MPETVDALADAARVAAYAKAFSAESVQLAYQICVQGRADLALAPDEPTGFAMTLLRLLAFEPATSHAKRRKRAFRRSRTGQAATQSPAHSESGSAPAESRRVQHHPRRNRNRLLPTCFQALLQDLASHAAAGSGHIDAAATPAAIADIADWPAFIAGMKLSGIALQLAAQTELKTIVGNELVPAVARGIAASDRTRHTPTSSRRRSMMPSGRRVRLRFDVGGTATASLSGPGETRARRVPVENRGRISRRSFRAGCTRAIRRQDQARLDQTG